MASVLHPSCVKTNNNPFNGGKLMNIIRYSRPQHDLFGRRFSDIMDEFFNDAITTRSTSFIPSMDVSETDKEVKVEVTLPGLQKSDIHLELENSHLTVSGERKMERENDDRRYHLTEIVYGTFRRSIQLPDHVDQESIKVEFNDGILHITMKKEDAKVRKEIVIK
jgi:HSP20 family protein